MQCKDRTAEARRQLLTKWGNPNDARAARKLSAARSAFKAKGFKPLLLHPLELDEFRVVMGNFPIYKRMPGDSLHLVSVKLDAEVVQCALNNDFRFWRPVFWIALFCLDFDSLCCCCFAVARGHHQTNCRLAILPHSRGTWEQRKS